MLLACYNDSSVDSHLIWRRHVLSLFVVLLLVQTFHCQIWSFPFFASHYLVTSRHLLHAELEG